MFCTAELMDTDCRFVFRIAVLMGSDCCFALLN